MKNFIASLLLCIAAVFSAQAQTAAITPTSVEVIGTSAASRAFYDLDDVYITYRTGTIKIYEASSTSLLFSGDTSAVSVTGATHWAAKATKLTNWYQQATTTTGFRYFIPKRGVQFVYKTSDTSVKMVHGESKKVLLTTALDSVKITGVTSVNNILTYLRSQYFLESSRDQLGLPNTVTVAAGAAAGSGATVTVAGTATDFAVTLTTGTTATNSGVLFTVTLPVTYPTGTIVTPTFYDSDAIAHFARVRPTSTASTVVLNAQTTALTDATAYTWNFHVAGY